MIIATNDPRVNLFDAVKMEADATPLAEAFAAVLRTWLTKTEMRKVNARNAGELDPGVCHSHDFCDANMAMHEAFISTIGRDPLKTNTETDGGMSQADTDLWSRAWTIAVRNQFYVEKGK